MEKLPCFSNQDIGLCSVTIRVEKILTFESRSEILKSLREELQPFLQETEISEEDQQTWLVAITEACTNCIRHAYDNKPGHPIWLKVTADEDKITATIKDEGGKIDLSKLPVPKIPPEKPGGLGIHFMKTILDQVEFKTGLEKGNELVLAKKKRK